MEITGDEKRDGLRPGMELSTTLLELFTPVLAQVTAWEISKSYGDPDELANGMMQLLARACEESVRQGKNPDWIPDAQYAVVAFVDESMNRAVWAGRNKWTQLPLAVRMGLPPFAGVVFFEKLKAWMQSPTPSRELLEVFYICLGLGFKGRYFNEPEHLKQLKHDLLHRLTDRENSPERLSPRAERGADLPPTPDVLAWPWYVTISAGVPVALFVILKLLTGSKIDNLMNSLGH